MNGAEDVGMTSMWSCVPSVWIACPRGKLCKNKPELEVDEGYPYCSGITPFTQCLPEIQRIF